MKQMVENTLHRFLACLLLIFISITILADDGGVLDRKIQLSKNKGTIFELLEEVSNKCGYSFIYDSQLIDNNKVVKIKKREYTLRDIIQDITGNKDLNISVIGNHILLQQIKKNTDNPTPIEEVSSPENNLITLSGVLYDQLNEEPIIYGSISVNNTSIGTVSNQNGEFMLVLPDSLHQSVIKFSHVGYLSREIEVSLLSEKHVRLALEPKVIPLQEVVVRIVDPLQIIKDMVDNRAANYSTEPVYQTIFYREGIEHKKKNMDITEAILKIYKAGLKNDVKHDQAKLIKMRRIVNKQEIDSIYPKIKSGINSCLTLDLIKNLPDFLTLDGQNPYTYTHTDISIIDNRRVFVIAFEQKKHLDEPLYKGKLFIDAGNSALLEVHFELNPDYAEKATSWFIERKNPKLNLKLQQAKYIVSYRLLDNDIYDINHIRGDLHFKVKERKRLFSSNLHLWFEMVNCKTDTINVENFSKKERLRAHNIFSETKYSYDKNFWDSFNVILPEDKLKYFIINNMYQIADIKDE